MKLLEKEEIQEEVKPEEKELAPDELPPISKEESPAPEAATPELQAEPEPQAAPEMPAAQPTEVAPAAQEVKGFPIKKGTGLYFSEILASYQDKCYAPLIEKELLSSASSEIIANLNDQWKKQKLEEDLSDFEQKILEKMLPMENLEEEWRSLKEEIDSKIQRKNEVEEEIQKNAFDIRKLIADKNRLKTTIGKQKETIKPRSKPKKNRVAKTTKNKRGKKAS